ncbi:hypothetical protein SFRURICE_001002 [Spodoptera frugiperda]|nr:hypothetical protein SFRURICE_001002 [Spodoptera frugiperda]
MTASLVEWSQARLPDKRSPGSDKVLLGHFRIFENVSLVARSRELYPVYGNRLTPQYTGLIKQMG